MSLVVHYDENRNPYPVEHYQTEHGLESKPATDPAILERFRAIHETQEVISFLRAAGAEIEFASRIGKQIFYGSPEEIAKHKAEAREVGLAWIENGGGSHTMRTIARIAFADDRRSAVDIYTHEQSLRATDLPPGSIDGVIEAEVSHYDERFLRTGASLIPVDAHAATTVDEDNEDYFGLNDLDVA